MSAFCDEGDCKQKAVGPCLFCEKDLCSTHGAVNEAKQAAISVATRIVFVCRADRQRPIVALGRFDELGEKRWKEYSEASATT